MREPDVRCVPVLSMDARAHGIPVCARTIRIAATSGFAIRFQHLSGILRENLADAARGERLRAGITFAECDCANGGTDGPATPGDARRFSDGTTCGHDASGRRDWP